MAQSLTQQQLNFDTVAEYRRFIQARAQETHHMCGLQGYNPMLGDVCPRCDLEFLDRIAVDPELMSLYASNHHIGEFRSKTMDTCEYCGEEGHWEEDCDELAFDEEGDTYNIQNFLGKLEAFLIDELDEDSRGNVFLSETGDNEVAINILVGAPFNGSGMSADCKQINVIIAPTDRQFLGSEGVSIDDMVERTNDADEAYVEERPATVGTTGPASHSWFDRAMSIFRND